MDVAKAKNIVIVLLIVLNIFLLYNNLTFVRGQGVRRETIENAEAILAKELCWNVVFLHYFKCLEPAGVYY